MRPTGQVALDLGPPFEDGARSSSDFEEIPHPAAHHAYWSPSAAASAPQPYTAAPAHRDPRPREEELPLHYSMSVSEEKARRRVPRGDGAGAAFAGPIDEKGLGYDDFDHEGKDVYSKMKAARGPIGSGRPRRPPPPPPTTVVRPLRCPCPLTSH